MEVISVPLEQIEVAPDQPRKRIDPVTLAELADSIIEQGLLQPIVLRYSDKPGRVKFYIVTGQRRWKAHMLAYDKTGDISFLSIDSIIRELSESAAYSATMIENIQREEITPLEEATGFQHLQERREAAGLPHSQEAIAKLVGKKRTHVANSLRILQLDKATLTLVEQAPTNITRGHLIPLVGLLPTDQVALLQRVIAGERTVRQLEQDAKLCRERYEGEKTDKRGTDVLRLLMRNLSQHVSSHIGNAVDIARFKDGGYRFEASFHSAAEIEGFLEKFGLKLEAEVSQLNGERTGPGEGSSVD